MSWLSNIFSPKKQEAAAVYKPYEDPSIALAKKNLEDIIAKRGYYNESEMGYTPSMISSTTAPYATARRENLKNYEIPLISSQASARGLGRSTIPVNRIALSGQEAERDIEQRIAELTTQSEALKANQKSQNASIYQNAITGITGIGTQAVSAENQARLNAANAQNANTTSYNANSDKLLNAIIQGVMAVATNGASIPFTASASAASLKNITADEIANAYEKSKRNAALVNLS